MISFCNDTRAIFVHIRVQYGGILTESNYKKNRVCSFFSFFGFSFRSGTQNHRREREEEDSSSFTIHR